MTSDTDSLMSAEARELALLREAFAMLVDRRAALHAPPELRGVIRRAYQSVEATPRAKHEEENRRRYREAVESVNRSTDREIDEAMKALWREKRPSSGKRTR